jgi:hypothetical protein
MLFDVIEEDGPQVSVIREPSAMPSSGKRLARERRCPYGKVIRPPDHFKRQRPSADASEPMALRGVTRLGGGYIADLNISSWQFSCVNQRL